MSTKKAIQKATPILLFDGVCHLCQRSVQFVIKHDVTTSICFGSLQSKTGQELLKKYEVPDHIDSLVFIDGTNSYIKSSAALKVASYFGLRWKWLSLGWLLPVSIRDAIYDWVARHRYKWFGKDDACLIPDQTIKKRFLD